MKIRAVLLAFASASAVAFATAAIPYAATPETNVVREVLPADVAPVQYFISVKPNPDALTFEGTARIEFEVLKVTSRVEMNAADLDIKSANLASGPAVRVAPNPEKERVAFETASPLRPGRYTISVAYTGKINESANGLFASAYKNAAVEPRTVLATQFEPGDARRLAPMWDEPARKAVFNMEAIVPAQHLAVSNMPVVAEAPAGEGWKRVTFGPSPIMSSYLLFLGVGDMERLEGAIGDTKLGIVAKTGDKDKGVYAMDVTKRLLPFYNDYFATPYPLPKLDQIAVPGAGGFGAMENWGAILYFEPYLLFDPALNGEADRQRIFSVVAHEIAHQWFGNIVTMSWWDDLWLNEGYASWMEQKAMDHFHPEWKPWLQALGGQEYAMELDARSTTHPIVTPIANVAEANQAFDAITYQKGEAVIRMLEAYIGEEPFRNGVRAYMAKHAYKNTVTNDLWSALEKSSDAPVRAIASDFTRQGGVPMISVNGVRCVNGRSEIALVQGRFGSDAESRKPTTWRVPVTAQTVGASEPAKAVVSGAGSVTAPGCGPVVVNKDRTGYYRVKYDAASYAALRDAFARLDAADQIALLYDAWALGAAGEAPVERYLELAQRTPAAADPLALRQIVGTLSRIGAYFDQQPGEQAFDAYAVATLKPMLQRVGWTAAAGEEPNMALLRSSLIGALVRFGDADATAEVRRRFSAMDKDPSAVPPALRSAIISAYGVAADEAAWNTLVAKAAAAKSPLEQRQYLGALASVYNPALAQKSLNLFLTDAAPKQLAPPLIRAVATKHPDLVWSFYTARRADIEAGLDPLQREEYGPSIAAASYDLKRAEELKAFAAANLSEAAAKPVAEAVAAIEQDAAVRRDRLPAVTAWLAANAPKR